MKKPTKCSLSLAVEDLVYNVSMITMRVGFTVGCFGLFCFLPLFIADAINPRVSVDRLSEVAGLTCAGGFGFAVLGFVLLSLVMVEWRK